MTPEVLEIVWNNLAGLSGPPVGGPGIPLDAIINPEDNSPIINPEGGTQIEDPEP